MEIYRVLWLSVCVPLGAIGAAVGLVVSPAAVVFLFIVFGAVGSLLTFCLVDAYWERGTGGRLRLLAGGALVAGTSVGAFVGYASLLGPGVLLLAAVVLARLAVRGEGRRSLAQIGPHTVDRPAGRRGACLCLRQPRVRAVPGAGAARPHR